MQPDCCAFLQSGPADAATHAHSTYIQLYFIINYDYFGKMIEMFLLYINKIFNIALIPFIYRIIAILLTSEQYVMRNYILKLIMSIESVLLTTQRVYREPTIPKTAKRISTTLEIKQKKNK